MQRTWRILLFLFVATYGIYLLRFLGESGGEVKTPAINALKGAASVVSLNYEIDHALSDAERNRTLQKDNTRLFTYFIFPPAGVLLSLITCIGLHFLKKRFPNPDTSRFLRRSAAALCIISLLSVLLPAIVFFSISGFRSLPLLELCSNKDTEPHLVVPGERVKVHVDYSPFVQSIQQRHQFNSISVRSLTFRNAVGESGTFALAAPPQDGSDDTPSDWPGLARGFSRAFPMAGINNVNVFLDLPSDSRLQGSLVNGDVEGGLEYPVRAGLDEVRIGNTHVTGHVSFWVANPVQAEFAAKAERFQKRRTDDSLVNVFLYSLIFCGGLCIGTGNIASKMKKA